MQSLTKVNTHPLNFNNKIERKNHYSSSHTSMMTFSITKY